MDSGDQSPRRWLTAARATLDELEKRRRAATTERARWLLDQAIDDQRAVVRRAEAAVQVTTVSLSTITDEFRDALARVETEGE